MIKQPVEQPILPNEQPVKSSKIKNVSDMDPEGNE
jgi:hypothetical protein